LLALAFVHEIDGKTLSHFERLEREGSSFGVVSDTERTFVVVQVRTRVSGVS
jgi:hypothetical protein